MITAVKINSRLAFDKSGYEKDIHLIGSRTQKLIEQGIVQILRKEAPKHRGTLRRSIKRVALFTSNARGEKTAAIVIGATAEHAKYVIGGVKRSDGHFVPTVELRFRNGEHPGMPANPFIARSRPAIDRKIKAIVESTYGSINIVKFMRLR